MIQETIYSRHIEDLQGNQLDVQIFQPKKKPQSQELSQDMFSGMHRKCIGKLLPGKMIIYSCKADLTPHINFSNCFCWNCLFNYLKYRSPEEAHLLADRYL